jgi:hypothetical protein
MGLRDHASADPGHHRDPVLRAFHCPFPDGRSTRWGGAGRGPAPLDGARLLRKGPQPPQGRPGHRARSRRPVSRRGRGAERAAGNRSFYRRRHLRNRPGSPRADSRRQRQTGASPLPRRGRLPRPDGHAEVALGARRGPHPEHACRRLHPGDHGPRRYRVHSPAPVRGLPRGRALRCPRPGRNR